MYERARERERERRGGVGWEERGVKQRGNLG